LPVNSVTSFFLTYTNGAAFSFVFDLENGIISSSFAELEHLGKSENNLV
jgi:hypothetical protein